MVDKTQFDITIYSILRSNEFLDYKSVCTSSSSTTPDHCYSTGLRRHEKVAFLPMSGARYLYLDYRLVLAILYSFVTWLCRQQM